MNLGFPSDCFFYSSRKLSSQAQLATGRTPGGERHPVVIWDSMLVLLYGLQCGDIFTLCILCAGVSLACMLVYCVCAVPEKTRRGSQMSGHLGTGTRTQVPGGERQCP